MANCVRPRIADVARAAGVSETTVSFTFNSPDRVRPETAARIRPGRDRAWVQASTRSRACSPGARPHTIGVVTPQALSTMFLNPFFSTFSAGVARAAEEHGYGLHFIAPYKGSLATAVERAGVDGVVAIGLSGDHPEVERIGATGLPTVLVDLAAFPSQGLARHRRRGRRSRGRRARRGPWATGESLVIGVKPPHPATRMDPDGVMGRRLRGYWRALSEYDIDLPEDWIVVGPATVTGGRRRVHACLGRWLPPHRRARHERRDGDRGRERRAWPSACPVPEHLSVVGFDDIEPAAFVDPPLTTVHQPMGEKGSQAVTLLLAAIERTDGWVIAAPPTLHLAGGASLQRPGTPGPGGGGGPG